MKMTYTDFYIISDKDTRGALNLIPRQNLDIDKVFRNELIPEDDIEFIPNYGSKAFDLLYSGYAGVYLVSKKIIELLSNNNINGWNNIPVKILGYENFEYSLLTVKGKCSAIEYENSKSFLKAPFTATGKPIECKRGLYFDLKSWDGSDIFAPKESRFTFVTEEVRSILSQSKATNLIFEKITRFEII